MKWIAVVVALISVGISACAPISTTPGSNAPPHRLPMSTPTSLYSGSPVLDRYTDDVVFGDLWKRPQLSRRDRSIVTLSVLIARNQTTDLPAYVNLALDSGVSPVEMSELVAHLAFYTGWDNATAAARSIQAIYRERGITVKQSSPASDARLPIDAAAEARRESAVQHSFGTVAPGVVGFTRDTLFNDLWLRPGLAPRDRSLATVSALVATGQVAQLAYHLNRAMDNGLTRSEASEVLTQLAFYAGWPNVFTALPIVRDVFDKRTGQ
ncbi:carboxymuconolactone decarboxylase family protein [Burkholderia multivorans]|uniref:carboxymuconolactone decarboxylase family protein n=1 Tax=Burkholderia multivorans TaxID=87883 RepID=UPI0030C71370